MPKQIEINSEFQAAFELIEKTQKNLFITGKAGSGKSTLLDYCIQNCSKNMIVLAPTGVAALNVKGQTIHRFFGFNIQITPEQISSKRFLPRAKRIYQKIDTIIIDEVSMLRADLLDCIHEFMTLYGPKKGAPFGGVQMVFVGDLYQLPPVITNQEINLFKERYNSPYFFDANVFKSITLDVIELSKIYRQTDHAFIELLSRIRSNNLSNSDVDTLNSRLNAELSSAGAENFCISLTTTNKLADNVNQNQLNNLEGSEHIATAVVDGSFSPEYFPTAEILSFKLGSQVMFLNNDSKNRWVNGSIGHIEDIKSSPERIKYVRIRLQHNQHLVDVFPYTWEVYKYRLDGPNEIVSDVIGSFTQYPFRLAWAVTIHKSQGKTFDNIKLDIGTGTFATGQLYVALSRCTSFEGISLQKPLSKSHILTDSRIVDFMSQYSNDIEVSLPSKLQSLQKAIPIRQKLEIIYNKADGQESKRIIIPLYVKGDNLLAFCTQRQEQRSFNIARIKKIKNTKE